MTQPPPAPHGDRVGEDLDHKPWSGEDEGRQGGHPQGMMSEAEVERQGVASPQAQASHMIG